MNDMIVKNVDVMGDSIMAAQDKDGVVWVGVKWVCNALGMTEGQVKRQINNIKKDMVFEKGVSNQIPLPTGGGEQSVFCIRNDFVPLWLAKINITKKTRDERPDFADKLLTYQLKAKDILAEAFLPKQVEFPKTTAGQIQLLAQGFMEIQKEVEQAKDDIEVIRADLEDFKNDLPVLPEDADRISDAVKKKGVELLGGKDSPAYNDVSIRRKLYSNLYWTLKYNFGVRSYKSIKRTERDRAMEVIEKYEPPVFLADLIADANAQQSFM